MLKSHADLFPLLMVQEPLNPDKDHHVVPDNTLGNDISHQRISSLRNQGSCGIFATGRAYINSFASLKLTMSESFAIARSALLDEPLFTLAHRTMARFFVNPDKCTGCARHLLLAAGAKRVQTLS